MEHTIIIAGIIVLLLLLTLRFFHRLRPKTVASPNYSGVALRDITIQDIDRMEGQQFEEYITRVLREAGYVDAYQTHVTGDYGADVVFTDRSGQRNIIQTKRYDTDIPVNLEAVQQVYTAKNYYQAKKTMVITSSTYRESAETLAGVNGVLLLDRHDLIQLIDALRKNDVEWVKNILERDPRIIYSFWDDPEYTRLINKTK
ncbi:hypothetical protein GCM10023228_36640 [Brevibacillus fulvus]